MKDHLRGVIFDFDNTLFFSPLDFKKIREEIGVEGSPILEYLQSAPPEERERGMAILERHERAAAEAAEPAPGALEILEFLEERGIPKAVLTRNSRSCVEIVFRRFPMCFDCVICRGEAPPKPSPEPVWKIARMWGVEPNKMLLVGDHRFDIESGRSAGAWTAFVTNGKAALGPIESDFVWKDLYEGVNHLREWIEGRHGGF